MSDVTLPEGWEKHPDVIRKERDAFRRGSMWRYDAIPARIDVPVVSTVDLDDAARHAYPITKRVPREISLEPRGFFTPAATATITGGELVVDLREPIANAKGFRLGPGSVAKLQDLIANPWTEVTE